MERPSTAVRCQSSGCSSDGYCLMTAGKSGKRIVGDAHTQKVFGTRVTLHDFWYKGPKWAGAEG